MALRGLLTKMRIPAAALRIGRGSHASLSPKVEQPFFVIKDVNSASEEELLSKTAVIYQEIAQLRRSSKPLGDAFDKGAADMAKIFGAYLLGAISLDGVDWLAGYYKSISTDSIWALRSPDECS